LFVFTVLRTFQSLVVPFKETLGFVLEDTKSISAKEMPNSSA